MTGAEAVTQALAQPTLAKSLAYIVQWENERTNHQPHTLADWELCFNYFIMRTMQDAVAKSKAQS